jgi:formyl-CoA transferase
LIAANGDSLFKRLMELIGRADLANDPDLARNDGRAKRAEEIDQIIGEWSKQRTLEDILSALQSIAVPAGRIYTAKDIAEDPHYRARGVIQTVESAGGLKVEMPGVVPKLSNNPGAIRHRAPTLGEHTDIILQSLGLSAEQIKALKEAGILH